MCARFLPSVCLDREVLTLDNVKWLVMDEADRLLENGFEQQVDAIVAMCRNKHRRMALFSATMPERVEDLARSRSHLTRGCAFTHLTRGCAPRCLHVLRITACLAVLHDPVRIHIGARNAAAASVDQRLLFAGREEGKLVAMQQLIQEGLKPPVLIFVQSKARAQDL